MDAVTLPDDLPVATLIAGSVSKAWKPRERDGKFPAVRKNHVKRIGAHANIDRTCVQFNC